MSQPLSEQSTSLRLAFASVVIFGGGAAALYLWPKERWIGFGLFGIAILMGLRWFRDELTPFTVPKRRFTAGFSIVVLMLVAAFLLKPVLHGNRKPQIGIPPNCC